MLNIIFGNLANIEKDIQTYNLICWAQIYNMGIYVIE
jgi:hypothetical protein